MNKSLIYILATILLIGIVSATPLGIIDSKYITTDLNMGGPVWQMTVRGDNDASYIVFGDKDNITGTSGTQTVIPANDFTLTQEITSESCEYTLIDTARNDIYHYDVILMDDNVFFMSKQKFLDQCYNSTGGILAWGEFNPLISGGSFQDIYCLKETPVANVGNIQEGKINFNADFSIKKDEQLPITKTVTTLATNANQISSTVDFTEGTKKIAIVRWIGGSTYGEMCPGQDDYVSVQYLNKWYTADKDKYTLYDEQYKQLKEMVSSIRAANKITKLQQKDLRTIVSATNSRGVDAYQQSMITADGMTATMSGTKAIIQLPRDHLIYAPDFQILISADWLGVVFQTSKPKIIDANFNSCMENQSNSFYATIQNVGTKTSTFTVGATCQAGISISTTSRNLKLDPGATGTITFPFTIDLENDASKSCTIQVSDQLNLGAEDRKSITTTCSASKICTAEGVKTCAFGEAEMICTRGQWIATGSSLCNTTICNRDSKCDAAKGESFEKCGGKLASNNDCATCNLNSKCDATETEYSCAADCGEPKAPISIWVYIAGGTLLAALVFYGLTQIKPAKKSKSRRK